MERDIRISYYEETSKGHPIASIAFYNGLSDLIGSERVYLKFKGNRLYFEATNNGHGLKLAFNKIQVWSMSDKLKSWVGFFPLKFDISMGYYFIEYEDRKELSYEDESKLGSRLGCTHIRDDHYDEHGLRGGGVIVENEKQEIVSSSEKVVVKVLFDKMLEFIENEQASDAKAIALAIKSLLNI